MSLTGETEAIIKRSLGALDERVRDLIVDAARVGKVEVGHLEASVRYHQGKGTVGGERMMIEQASPALARSIIEAFGVPAPPVVTRLMNVAQDEGVPLITGWDLGSAAPVAKLYVNASNLEAAARRRLADRLRPEIGALPECVGHVFGVNVGQGLVEVKCYQQSSDFSEIACGLGQAAQRLVRAVRDPSLVVGSVVAWDIRPHTEARQRAFFLTFRNASPDDVASMLAELSDNNVQALGEALPFTPGPITSIGTALRGPHRITVYVRREPLERWTVEPAAIFASGDREIAVFLDPTIATVPAYRVTKHHRVSFRASGPEASPEIVDALMRWVVGQVRAFEAPNAALSFDQPPPRPWQQVR